MIAGAVPWELLSAALSLRGNHSKLPSPFRPGQTRSVRGSLSGGAGHALSVHRGARVLRGGCQLGGPAYLVRGWTALPLGVRFALSG
ncbi:hypothetical protein PDTK01_32080 [Phycicoccus sp. DTK01]|nr:hypothetical protein PDTK01_32080 [Phycicoccus sp. DTK01]